MKEPNCSRCKRNDYCFTSDFIPIFENGECNVFVVKTNGDLFREMKDEELANFAVFSFYDEFSGKTYWRAMLIPGAGHMVVNSFETKEEAIKANLEWLQKESK